MSYFMFMLCTGVRDGKEREEENLTYCGLAGRCGFGDGLGHERGYKREGCPSEWFDFERGI
jgi:hypothetical protein